MAAVSLLRLAESLLLKTVSTYLSEFLLLTPLTTSLLLSLLVVIRQSGLTTWLVVAAHVNFAFSL